MHARGYTLTFVLVLEVVLHMVGFEPLVVVQRGRSSVVQVVVGEVVEDVSNKGASHQNLNTTARDSTCKLL